MGNNLKKKVLIITIDDYCFYDDMLEKMLQIIFTQENVVFLKIVLGFSQLYMVTILQRRQEERNATRFKML